jgi:transposase
MAKNQKSYTREFKIEAVRLLRSTGKSQTEIERELGIGSSNLSRWKKQFGEEGEEAFVQRQLELPALTHQKSYFD